MKTRKLGTLDKRQRARSRKLAAVTHEEREAYRQWHRTHKPGSKEARAAERARRDADRTAARLTVTVAPAATSPERDRLAAERAQIEQEIALLEISIYGEGVFG